MGLIFRKTKKLGKNTRANVTKSGVSVTRKFGPLSINSRGRVTLRLFKGMSWRIFG